MHFVQRQRRVRHQQLILVFGIKVQLVSYTYFVSSCPAAACHRAARPWANSCQAARQAACPATRCHAAADCRYD